MIKLIINLELNHPNADTRYLCNANWFHL